MSVYVRMEAVGGTSTGEGFDGCRRVAMILQSDVVWNHNGVDLFVGPTTTLEDVERQYSEGLKQEREWWKLRRKKR